MSLYLMLKLIAASVSFAYYMKKTQTVSFVENTALTLFYVFSGYILQYYTNIAFLDVIAIFPIIMLGLEYMYRGRGVKLYVISLAWCTMINMYLCIMVYFYIIFRAFGLMRLIPQKEERKRFAAKLGLYTIFALMMSMVIVLPALSKWSNSPRVSTAGNGGYLDILKLRYEQKTGDKLFMLYGCEAGLAAAAAAFISKIKNRQKADKKLLFYIYLLVLLIIPIAAEPVNAMWHMGSYVWLPCGYAFMLPFTAAEACAYVMSDKKREKSAKAGVYIFVLLAAAALYLMSVFSLRFMDHGIYRLKAFLRYIPVLAVLVVMFGAVMVTMSRKTAGRILCAAAVILSFTAALGFIAPKRYVEEDTKENTVTSHESLKAALSLSSVTELKHDNISRIKTVYPMLSDNFGYLVGAPAISEYTRDTTKEMVNIMNKFGYTIDHIRNESVGGTAFTDALLHTTNALSRTRLNDALYTKTAESGDFGIYECKYVLPFGIFVNDSIKITSFPAEGIKQQNLLYNALSGEMDTLIENCDKYFVGNIPKNGAERLVYRIPADGTKTLYVKTRQDMECSFYINDRLVEIPYFDNLKNGIYPKEFNSGFIELGTFKDETAELAVMTTAADKDGIEIGLMDNEKLEKLTQFYADKHAENVNVSGRKMTMTAQTGGECLMFLPVCYSTDWRAEVNGTEADIYPVIGGAFMAVSLPAGNCDIKLVFVPRLYLMGLALGLCGLMLFVWALVRVKENLDWTETKFMKNAAYYCYTAVWVGFMIFMYIIPTLAAVLTALNIL